MKEMSFLPKLGVVVIFLFWLHGNALASDREIVAGAGPSEKICRTFFAEFGTRYFDGNTEFSVMEGSIKHKGGIQHSDNYLFGRTGRPLNAAEHALGKNQIFLAKVPIAFAKGLKVDVSSLSIDDIEKIFSKKITNWKELGGIDAPIVTVGREPTEALFMTLKEDHPFFRDVSFDLIFRKDDDIVKFLKSPKGCHAISFGARPNFNEQDILVVSGFRSGVKLGLVYDVKNEQNPVVQNVLEFADSDEWSNVVQTTSMLPVH